MSYIEFSFALMFFIWDTVFYEQLVIEQSCSSAIWVSKCQFSVYLYFFFSSIHCIDMHLTLHLMMSNKMSLSVFGSSLTVC